MDGREKRIKSRIAMLRSEIEGNVQTIADLEALSASLRAAKRVESHVRFRVIVRLRNWLNRVFDRAAIQ